MMAQRCSVIGAGLVGLLVGLLIWGVLLGATVRQHDPGLWTLRFRRVLACGLDYNGPPYTPQVTIWLSCGEAEAWRLWPPFDRSKSR